MNYIQAISEFFKTGSFVSGTLFSQDIQAALERDRRDLESKGLTLVIQPQGDVIETIEDKNDGSKTVMYKGSFVQAFQKDGLLQPTPNGKPFENQDDAIEQGSMIFEVDASGQVVGWFNSLDGNAVGKMSFTSGMTKENKRLLLFIIVVMVLFVLWKFFGGLLF